MADKTPYVIVKCPEFPFDIKITLRVCYKCNNLQPVPDNARVVQQLIYFILIVISAIYGYYKVIPLSIDFMTRSGFIPGDVGMLLNFSRNIFFVLQFLFFSLLLFQTPVILELFLIMNILTRKAVWNSLRYIIITIFIFS